MGPKNTQKQPRAAKKATKKAKAASEFYDDGEDFVEPVTLPTSFRFFDLPSEIRLNVYHFVLFTPTKKSSAKRNAGAVGASAKKAKLVAPAIQRIALFLSSKRIHEEASHFFYSSQIFRVFHIQDFSRRPTLRGIPRCYRPLITTIELILGNSWTSPPKSWSVDDGMGLHEMTLLHTLRVFVECDPSQPVFEGFRVSKEYYTEFSGRLLKEILERLPALKFVEFDAYPSVKRNGSLMTRLMKESRAANKKLLWGPEKGWTDDDDIGYVYHEDPIPVASLDTLPSYYRPAPVDDLTRRIEDLALEVRS
ncbi:hypothetical protein N7454_006215 [Penicillium verhagenii]|nr:hypothetical protein N7454_006215 [Penicillium verhagenii]